MWRSWQGGARPVKRVHPVLPVPPGQAARGHARPVSASVACARRGAIVSSKFRHRIQAFLDRAGHSDAVDLILGAEDVQLHKPHPQGLLLALESLQVEPARSLYVGDHVVDAQAAASAGVAFVAVRTGSSSPESWSVAASAIAPVAIIDDAAGLLSLLERTGRLG